MQLLWAFLVFFAFAAAYNLVDLDDEATPVEPETLYPQQPVDPTNTTGLYLGKEKTLLEVNFGSEQKFERIINKTFEKLDTDHSSALTYTELTAIVSKIFKDQTPINFSQEFFASADGDNDQTLTLVELKTAMVRALNQTVIVKPKVCKSVKEIMKPCQRAFNTHRNLTVTFDRGDARLIYSSCKSGVSSLSNFQTERCIMSVTLSPFYIRGSDQSCLAVKQCVNSHFDRSARESIKNDLAFTNGNIVGWGALMWIGFAGAIIFSLLLFIPGIGFVLGLTFLFTALAFLFMQTVSAVGQSAWVARRDTLVPPWGELVTYYLEREYSDERPSAIAQGQTLESPTPSPI